MSRSWGPCAVRAAWTSEKIRRVRPVGETHDGAIRCPWSDEGTVALPTRGTACHSGHNGRRAEPA